MEILKDFLIQNGVDVFIPGNFTHHPRWQGSEDEVIKFAYKLTIDHFEKMKQYDIVLNFNCDGSIGLSITMELDCAYGFSKSIYAIPAWCGRGLSRRVVRSIL